MDSNSPTFSDMLVPALVGGGVAGLLWGIPLLGCLCCLWLPLGGAVAIYMLRAKTIGTREVLLAGILCAFFAALAGTLVEGGVSLVMGQNPQESFAQSADLLREMGYPPEALDQAEQFMESFGGGAGPLQLVCGFFFRLFFGALFAIAGAFLAKTFMKPRATGQA